AKRQLGRAAAGLARRDPALEAAARQANLQPQTRGRAIRAGPNPASRRRDVRLGAPCRLDRRGVIVGVSTHEEHLRDEPRGLDRSSVPPPRLRPCDDRPGAHNDSVKAHRGAPQARVRGVPRLYYLGGFVPAAVILDLLGVSATFVFVASALGVIPAASLMSDATEQLAEHSGPGVAGLLNVTFGNAPELIIALFALADGLQEVVKASLVGSVIGNALLVLGAAMFAGGRRREVQLFSARAARAQSATLLAGTAALVVPSLVRLAQGDPLPAVGAGRADFGPGLEALSIVLAVGLIAAYARGVVVSLRAHSTGFPAGAQRPRPRWSRRRALGVLAIAAALVAVASDTLVGSVEHASSQIGLSQFFIGL